MNDAENPSADVLYRELTGINQYFVHAKMRRNWGDAALYEVNSKESIGEMNHADHTIDRILFLEGVTGFTARSGNERNDICC